MKFYYTIIFFLDLLAIGGLAFVLFQEVDGRAPACDKMILGLALILAIALMVLLILDYLRRGTGPSDK
ncbi:hypothetical protein [Puia dinghuensis]|uniref:Uncharacterized protein n=1 Tax=Puia dinghuensis TaxID=1792502 RepID=A0A8J2UDA0_9BACT|nr:hypothetical protein [Puia dinghuensis]GGB01304.1 hypothetical protein GCM10011511_25780 [Puia dinghuensis]